MKNILIVKTSALGDVVHTYPVIDYLSKKFPEAKIDWVVEAPNAELVQAHPKINRAVTFTSKAWRRAPLQTSTWKEIQVFRQQLREKEYDIVFDLQGNIKSGLIVSQVRSRCKVGFAWKTVPEWPNVLFTNRRYNPQPLGNIRHDYISIVTSYFNDPLPKECGDVVLSITDEQRTKLTSLMPSQEGRKVLVCSGSAWRNKQLTRETLAAFLKLINEEQESFFLFAWGSKEEQEVAQYLHAQLPASSKVIERVSLSMLQNLMAMCDLAIAMDSLPLHLAGTTQTPSFSVFGASSAQKYKPLGDKHCAFQGSCPYGKTFVKRCPILRTCSTGACIRDLHAHDLFSFYQRAHSQPLRGDCNH